MGTGPWSPPAAANKPGTTWMQMLENKDPTMETLGNEDGQQNWEKEMLLA